MAGLVAHPWEGLDVYGYAGIEQVNARSFNVDGAPFGYGNPNFNNTGCLLVSAGSFAGVPAPLGGCVANTRRLFEITGGFWQNLYKGNYGRVAVGAEYAFVRKEAFDGIGGAPKTDNNIVLTSLRYYPWTRRLRITRWHFSTGRACPPSSLNGTVTTQLTWADHLQGQPRGKDRDELAAQLSRAMPQRP